jgi:NAD-dependent deacetylase
VIDRALRAASETDCLVCVGTSLQVYPVAGAVPTAKANGAHVIIVNAQETAFDDLADVKLTDHISEVLPQLCAAS